MPHAMAQVVLAHENGLAKDACVNTFHFDTGPTAVLIQAPIITTLLVDFYNADIGSGFSTNQRLGTTVSRAPLACRVKVYDMSQPMPRVPVTDTPFTLDPAGDVGTTLPQEVALCLSYRGAQISGIPPARRRGRVFIGPLANETSVLSFTTGRPVAGLRSHLLRIGIFLRDNPDTQWCVFSRIGEGALVPITDFWVDDAFDTQRRRGPAATLKQTTP